MNWTRIVKPWVGLALSAAVVGACAVACTRAKGPLRSGMRVGMTKAEFEALKLPVRFAIGSGPMTRYSEVYELSDGQKLATLWNHDPKPPRLLWFKLNP